MLLSFVIIYNHLNKIVKIILANLLYFITKHIVTILYMFSYKVTKNTEVILDKLSTKIFGALFTILLCEKYLYN
ncbi:hypothetical protein ADU90_12265 [Clostridium botulinum]|uniref:Uncharacterized protein n=1 Tax=Clostridium botulinum C/D str. DC5 TaxID=1443128 RepID=A0A0A0IFF4_CLOBO|nr:hypothetical protein Z952_00250 [Clostridium botulinum C/D str. BKT75002]KEI11710.1 hypothetical protein Z954_07235 [Clostridium botulinum C/D str. BKT2873]KGM95024.1 hypothetical protein Z956_05925 [Clostridium botulinum D str. CCUG 7971]KGN00195.1 hypothetical protein Z955_04155 [Clostridium botulinum C/D str. DC5]KOC50840.1 hypothetical protein ADU88_01225 [Clostridium botulinum]OOV53228.1 hypothetical protein B1A66_00065 [Clostridium botulinum D/C]